MSGRERPHEYEAFRPLGRRIEKPGTGWRRQRHSNLRSKKALKFEGGETEMTARSASQVDARRCSRRTQGSSHRPPRSWYRRPCSAASISRKPTSPFDPFAAKGADNPRSVPRADAPGTLASRFHRLVVGTAMQRELGPCTFRAAASPNCHRSPCEYGIPEIARAKGAHRVEQGLRTLASGQP